MLFLIKGTACTVERMIELKNFTSGPDLVAERYRYGFRALDIAAVLGVTPSAVCEIEHRYRVTPRQVNRYRAALVALRGESDQGTGAEVLDE